jgi:type VI secretion system protein ImpG
METSQLKQIGFEEEDALYPRDERFFSGFEILRNYFVFPQNFAGFKLEGLRRQFSRIDAQSIDILFEFSATFGHLTSIVNRDMFGLFVAPATNLFEMRCSRIPVSPGEYEHLVVADRGRWLEFEVHRILDVSAHYPGHRDPVPVFPLYSLPTTNIALEDALYYTSRGLPRLKTERERRFGSQSNYLGTETFVSLYEPAGLEETDRVKELSVTALVSNRHLTEHLPVGNAGADFTLAADTTVHLNCVVGPTKPQDSIIHMERKRRDATKPGPLMWRLLNLLSLNHLGLVDRSAEDRAAGMHELLSLFADISDDFTESQVRGVISVSTRPVVRRLRQANGFNAARGLEVTVTFDEKAYEGSGVMILGAALDRFFAEYTSINSFTQTIVASMQRGVIVRWPPRSGMGGVL